jgi:uncharacterized phiE125 gp8 family phage protein
MNLVIVTPPPFLPISLADVYSYLRLDTEGSPATHPLDAMLTRYMRTATAEAEKISRRSFVQQRLRLSTGAFPKSGKGIELLRPPLIRVESVGYLDGDNFEVALGAGDWYVTDDRVPQVRMSSGFGAPSLYDRPDALRITYIAGYPPSGSPSETQEDYAGNIPDNIKDAVLMGVQLLYANLTPDERAAVERAREYMLSGDRIFLNG